MIWIKNTEGKDDAILTLSVLGFFVVIIKLLLAGVVISLGKDSISFGGISATEIAAILTPTLGAYVARRYTDVRYCGENCPTCAARKEMKDDELS